MNEKRGQTNASLGKARAAKNDEFYTRAADIAEEIRHYRPHFRGKTVYCNCDDPTVSGFYDYFMRNFAHLGLKRLITTCYQSKNPFGWTRYKDKNGCRLIYDGPPGKKPRPKMLRGDGDFRSDECIALLREADIVCTNPPFSLFRKYVEQLVAENKKFLIIGNMNAAQYKEILRLIMEGKLWIGYKPMGADMLFNVPSEFAAWLVANKKEGSGYRVVDGKVLGRSPAIWYTNLPHKKRNEWLNLGNRYEGNESAYPKYDNYDAIEVSKVANIPRDYAGVMGVPYSFLDKWNPEQFELLGDNRWHDGSWKSNDINVINGKQIARRLLIRNRKPE